MLATSLNTLSSRFSLVVQSYSCKLLLLRALTTVALGGCYPHLCSALSTLVRRSSRRRRSRTDKLGTAENSPGETNREQQKIMWGTVGIAGSTNRTEQPNQGENKEDKTKDPIAFNKSIDVEADRIKGDICPLASVTLCTIQQNFKSCSKWGASQFCLVSWMLPWERVRVTTQSTRWYTTSANR